MFASNENTLAHAFLNLDRAFLDAVGGDEASPSFDDFADLLGAATLNFGLCELHDRRALRFESVGGQDFASAHKERSVAYQTRGLEILDRAIRLEKPMVRDFMQAEKPTGETGAIAVNRFREDFMSLIADSELKPKDVGRIQELIDEAAKTVLSGENLGQWLSEQAKTLSEARRSEDRGNRDNLPWWKIVIIAAYVGLSVWKIWRCTVRKRCRRGEKAAYEAAAVVLGISLKFC